MIYFLNELWIKWINDLTIFVVNNFIGVFHIMNSIAFKNPKYCIEY